MNMQNPTINRSQNLTFLFIIFSNKYYLSQLLRFVLFKCARIGALSRLFVRITKCFVSSEVVGFSEF